MRTFDILFVIVYLRPTPIFNSANYAGLSKLNFKLRLVPAGNDQEENSSMLSAPQAANHRN